MQDLEVDVMSADVEWAVERCFAALEEEPFCERCRHHKPEVAAPPHLPSLNNSHTIIRDQTSHFP